ncbi:MAG TPA: hypothetical protein VJH24_05845 [Candidatus Bilamarchaeaceae archaeon]|nr:hypothetical protein [Candidatus Bilamarchaeaceae archaeon]
MAKRRFLSKLFSLWVKVVSFLFGMVFALLRTVANAIVSLLRFLGGFLRTQARKKQMEMKKPKTEAVYSEWEVRKTVDGSVASFEEWLFRSKSTIGIILGSRGSGKSALGMRILENLAAQTKKPVCAMGFQEESLPSWIRTVEKIQDIRNGSFVLIDEGGVLFSSRGSMSSANKILSELLLIARHKDLSVLFISQNSANLEVNAIRQADYLLLRKSSLLQKDFERKKIKEVYTEAEENFDEFFKAGHRLTYVYSDAFRGYAQNKLPNFWTEKTSKSFKDFKK